MKLRARLSAHGDRRPPDEGFSLVEVLVAIVLISTVTVALLVSLRVSVKASGTDRDHINAHAWLQGATDILYGDALADCGSVAAPDEAGVRNTYSSDIQAAPSPLNWNGRIEIVAPVKFWNGETYGTTCYADMGIYLQLITLRVYGPRDEIVESVEIVKG